MILENNTYPFDTRVRNEAETLARAGFTITIICPKGRGQHYHETINGVRIMRYPSVPGGRGLFTYLLEYGNSILAATLLTWLVWVKDGLDVIHYHNPPDILFIAGLLPKIARKILIYDHHDLSPELYLSKFDRCSQLTHRLLLAFERFSCRLADWVITVNESYRQNDIQRNNTHPDRIRIVRNGPDLDRIRPVPPDPEIRNRAQILLAYLGNISHQDGVDHLLRALYYLDNDLKFTNWFCIIIGRADNASNLQNIADELNLSNRIWFTGYIPDELMLRILSTADICIAPDPLNPLNEKSTMIKILEYMALNKPVVAYDLLENRVSAGDAALYARPNDPFNLAEQILNLVKKPELRQQMGMLGQNRIIAGLSWNYSSEQLLSLYMEATQHNCKKAVRREEIA
jgi:glycosyltransferase involved in cell wall biosynthesis